MGLRDIKDMIPENPALAIVLEPAVQLAVYEFMGSTDDDLAEYLKNNVDIISNHSDDLLLGGKHCKQAFCALVRSLACLMLLGNEVNFMGKIWKLEDYLKKEDADW